MCQFRSKRWSTVAYRRKHLQRRMRRLAITVPGGSGFAKTHVRFWPESGPPHHRISHAPPASAALNFAISSRLYAYTDGNNLRYDATAFSD